MYNKIFKIQVKYRTGMGQQRHLSFNYSIAYALLCTDKVSFHCTLVKFT